jgi:hypothetical protein
VSTLHERTHALSATSTCVLNGIFTLYLPTVIIGQYLCNKEEGHLKTFSRIKFNYFNCENNFEKS